MNLEQFKDFIKRGQNAQKSVDEILKGHNKQSKKSLKKVKEKGKVPIR